MSLMVALLFGLVCFLLLLVIGGIEAFVCIIMASPLIIIVAVIGTGIGYAARRIFDKLLKNSNAKLSLVPLFALLLAGTFEHYFVGEYDYVKVSTSIYLPYNPDKVYDYIKSVDTLNTEQPFLMKLGLPVPQKCILEKEQVGAVRTCYFANGVIEEKVIAIKRGEILKMDVTKYTLPLPTWIKFNEAIYLFEKKGNGTLITRITTYKTSLKPRFYFRYCEVKAIEAEHEYVLADLRQRLEKSTR